MLNIAKIGPATSKAMADRGERREDRNAKTFFIASEGLSFSEKQNFDKKLRTQALSFC